MKINKIHNLLLVLNIFKEYEDFNVFNVFFEYDIIFVIDISDCNVIFKDLK